MRFGACLLSKALKTRGLARIGLRALRGLFWERFQQQAAPMRHLLRAVCALAVSLTIGNAAAQAQPCPHGWGPGRHTLLLPSRGVDRSAVLFMPFGAEPGRPLPLPLVLELHGSEGTAEQQLDLGQWEGTAQAQGIIVVAPQALLPVGRGFRWNVPGVTPVAPGISAPDDVQFLLDLLAFVTSRTCVDGRRVYGSGYSGGARMVAQLACNHAGTFAAIGLVAGLRAGTPRPRPDGGFEPDPASCRPQHPVPVIAFAGSADRVNPPDGGGQPYWGYGVAAAQQRWAALNGCVQGPETRAVSATTRRVAFEACREQARVVLYLSEGSGHAWPGSRALLRAPSPLTPVPFDIDATALMWQFFESYRLAPRQPSAP